MEEWESACSRGSQAIPWMNQGTRAVPYSTANTHVDVGRPKEWHFPPIPPSLTDDWDEMDTLHLSGTDCVPIVRDSAKCRIPQRAGVVERPGQDRQAEAPPLTPAGPSAAVHPWKGSIGIVCALGTDGHGVRSNCCWRDASTSVTRSRQASRQLLPWMTMMI
ncbi:hypothetical protein ASPWEDRAFT_30971 [Aspergillus wentii DTO 134E9]|uniref:Uncharacterized protein n=1 Tax=Aspergillus wentii DTO 134E9 TaxID=1073089 RepID=A0A1L9RAW1_ASPWE|nr:uncharacterized protein ASPWEDRAFT_30971 [Aspergillus wentii DTO 134E9]OJJ32028.1 hypothetical protein ASPWEDRAFT_30971 [Aspergillus wentii DTO 134E9]